MISISLSQESSEVHSCYFTLFSVQRGMSNKTRKTHTQVATAGLINDRLVRSDQTLFHRHELLPYFDVTKDDNVRRSDLYSAMYAHMNLSFNILALFVNSLL